MLELLQTEEVENPLANATLVKDLVWYEGPLLSHFKDEAGNSWLAYWCDCDWLPGPKRIDRWMFVQTSEETIAKVADGKIQLLDAIPGSSNYAYFRDGIDGKVLRMWTCHIPSNYLPEEGAFIE